MRLSKYIVLLLILTCSACRKTTMTFPVTVGFSCGDETRTCAVEDGTLTHWAAGDEVSLWASNGSTNTLEAKPFRLYASDGSRAWFSSTLSSAMPDNTYIYRACYPVPLYVNGNKLTFSVPSVQNGLASDGADIMISAPSQAGPLKEPEDTDLSLSFNHLLHLLRFYLPSGAPSLGGPIEKIVLTFPKNVNGTIEADLQSASQSASTLTGNTVTLNLKEPLSNLASSEGRDYVFATIAPTGFSTSDYLKVKLYSATKVCNAEDICLKGRNMLGGHTTAIALVAGEAKNYCRMILNIAANNLGENLDKLTLRASSGCVFPSSGTNEISFTGQIGEGDSFIVEFEDESMYRAFSKTGLELVYDSEHVTMTETLSLPDMSSGTLTTLTKDIPYLLFEDFSTVGSFSSNDEYKTSSAGSKSAHSFLNGWTGGRVGAEAGHCIRTACRRETSADYHSRVDSAPIKATLKKAANLKVSFDYGANNQYGGITIVTDGNVGQDCYIGYVTSTDGYSSGSTSGTFESGNTFYVKEYTGSYTNTPNDCSYVLHDVPAGKTIRISVRTEVEHQAGTTNTTAWLYIDNFKVQIAQ